jgi:hypothetical protein
MGFYSLALDYSVLKAGGLDRGTVLSGGGCECLAIEENNSDDFRCCLESGGECLCSLQQSGKDCEFQSASGKPNTLFLLFLSKIGVDDTGVSLRFKRPKITPERTRLWRLVRISHPVITTA